MSVSGQTQKLADADFRFTPKSRHPAGEQAITVTVHLRDSAC
jgi:hypothetical protein